MMVLSEKSFEMFRKLSEKEKRELKPHFQRIGEELRQILEWYRDNPNLLEKDLFGDSLDTME
jgi:hypothetical protein